MGRHVTLNVSDSTHSLVVISKYCTIHKSLKYVLQNVSVTFDLMNRKWAPQVIQCNPRFPDFCVIHKCLQYTSPSWDAVIGALRERACMLNTEGGLVVNVRACSTQRERAYVSRWMQALCILSSLWIGSELRKWRHTFLDFGYLGNSLHTVSLKMYISFWDACRNSQSRGEGSTLKKEELAWQADCERYFRAYASENYRGISRIFRTYSKASLQVQESPFY